MNKIEKEILSEIKQILIESTTSDDWDDAIISQSTPTQPQSSEDAFQAGGGDLWSDNNDSDNEESDFDVKTYLQSTRDNNGSNDEQDQNIESEAIKYYQHRAKTYTKSIQNLIVGYAKFLKRIKKAQPDTQQQVQEANEQEDESTDKKENVDAAGAMLKEITAISKGVETLIAFAKSDNTSDEPFSSYPLETHMKTDKLTVRWANQYKKRAPDADMTSLKSIASLAPLLKIPPEQEGKIQKLLQKAKNAIHSFKSLEWVDRLTDSAPIEVEGGLYVVARYIKKALSNYFYTNFKQFQSGKKRKIQAALEMDYSNDLKNLFNYHTLTKKLLKSLLQTAEDNIEEKNIPEIVETWESLSSSAKIRLRAITNSTDARQDKHAAAERLINVIEKITKTIKRAQNDNNLAKELISFLAAQAKADPSLQESKNKQFENKLELLIEKELKRIKNG